MLTKTILRIFIISGIFQRHRFFLTKFRKTVCPIRGKIILYLEYQNVCTFVRFGSLALSPASKCVPLLDPKGGGHTCLRVRGRWEPIWTAGEKAWHSVYSRRYKTTGGCVRVNIRLYQRSPISAKLKQSNLKVLSSEMDPAEIRLIR